MATRKEKGTWMSNQILSPTMICRVHSGRALHFTERRFPSLVSTIHPSPSPNPVVSTLMHGLFVCILVESERLTHRESEISLKNISQKLRKLIWGTFTKTSHVFTVYTRLVRSPRLCLFSLKLHLQTQISWDTPKIKSSSAAASSKSVSGFCGNQTSEWIRQGLSLPFVNKCCYNGYLT